MTTDLARDLARDTPFGVEECELVLRLAGGRPELAREALNDMAAGAIASAFVLEQFDAWARWRWRIAWTRARWAHRRDLPIEDPGYFCDHGLAWTRCDVWREIEAEARALGLPLDGGMP